MSVERTIVGISMMTANTDMKNTTLRDLGHGAWRGRENTTPEGCERKSVLVFLDLVFGIDDITVVRWSFGLLSVLGRLRCRRFVHGLAELG